MAPNSGDVDPAEIALVLAFDTDDEQFARGFEAGLLWAEMRDADRPVETMIHASNTELALRMAEAAGRDLTGEILDDTWTLVMSA